MPRYPPDALFCSFFVVAIFRNNINFEKKNFHLCDEKPHHKEKKKACTFFDQQKRSQTLVPSENKVTNTKYLLNYHS